jgi:transcriptional regulator GlxA family with amidase domain
MPEPRRILLLAFPSVQLLDVTGPSETFAIAERLQPGSYAVELVAPRAGEIVSSSGLKLVVEHSLAQARGRVDTLLVAGGAGIRAAVADRELVSAIANTAQRARRVASVCTGSFLLAEAGLLAGRRACTHWAAANALARLHPDVEVDPQPIYVRDGNVYTSAGVTAGIDLALTLVEEDLGHELALAVARSLVLFVRRRGGQAQFSVSLAGETATARPLRELQSWMSDHLHEDLRVETLAQRACMSPRNFARVFRNQTGTTPARYVEALRVERARSLLEQGGHTISQVATAAGFGTVETLRRSFVRELGIPPSNYRDTVAS